MNLYLCFLLLNGRAILFCNCLVIGEYIRVLMGIKGISLILELTIQIYTINANLEE
jgi:hypothetical protein